MATAEKTQLIPAEAMEQLIVSEVLSLKTRADMMMIAFFADPQKRGSGWGDIVDMSNRVDLDDFISYRRNLVPENWRDENRRQMTDRLIQEIDTLANVESRARHHIYLSEFARTYIDGLLEIRKTRKKEEPTKVNEFKLGYFLAGVQTGVPIAMKQSLFFACLASEYGNLALSEIDISRRDVLLKRARFFHQASLFEGKSSGYFAFTGDESMRGPVAVEAEEAAREVGQKTETAQAEMVLTSEERMMIDGLGIVAAWERNEPNAKLTDFAKFSGETNGQHLQTTFRDLQFSFYLLPADSRLRSEIIKSALGQLGETGEKLRKSGKTDREIFDEWLKQVFLALYRRARKKP